MAPISRTTFWSGYSDELQSENDSLLGYSALMMKEVRTSETSVYFNETTQRYILEDFHLQASRRENLKSHSDTVWSSGGSAEGDSRKICCSNLTEAPGSSTKCLVILFRRYGKFLIYSLEIAHDRLIPYPSNFNKLGNVCTVEQFCSLLYSLISANGANDVRGICDQWPVTLRV
jgi:hypothetical protein